MKNNKIFSLLAAAAFVASVPSCTDLDERIYDQLPAETFGGNATEVNALLGTTYNTLKTYGGGSDSWCISEASGSVRINPTREGGDWWDSGQYLQLFMHSWTNQNGAIRGCWNAAFQAIGTCNSNYKIIEASTVPDRDQNLLEVRAIRAFWYYVLVDNFGNAPLVTDYADRELHANSTRAELFTWLEKELKEIIPGLPASSHDNYGKFTQGAAWTLLAKMYLNSEAWGLGDKYADALNACNEVLKGDYILEPNWDTNFAVSNDASKEAILAAQYSASDTKNTNAMHNQSFGYSDHIALQGNFSAWNGFCAQPDYIRLFINEGGAGNDESFTVNWTKGLNDGINDPRIKSFLLGQMTDPAKKPGDEGYVLTTGKSLPNIHCLEVYPMVNSHRDGTQWGEVRQQDGGRCFKWEVAKGMSSTWENDMHIFRLADVYLMKAECLLRTGGDVALATKLVNDVRSRAYGNHSHDYATVDLAKVQLERRLELAWEGFSRQDDIRFDCFNKDMWSMFRGNPTSEKTDANGHATDWEYVTWERPNDAHLKLFPIPLTAWQTNPQLVQNPGYPQFSN